MVRTGVGAAAVGAIVSGACAWAGGASLGTLFGPFALTAGLVPQAAVGRRAAGIYAFAVSVGVTASWIGFTDIRPGAALAAGALLLAWTLLLAAATGALVPRRRANRPGRGTHRAAGVTGLAWAWLAWPIWLGPTLATSALAPPTWVTAVHPLLAVNAAAVSLGIWTQQPLAYQLTPLGQDLAYAMPSSAWPCALAQSTAAVILWGFSARRGRRSYTGGNATAA